MKIKCKDYLVAIVYVLSCTIHISAYSTAHGKGIFQTYNAKKSSIASGAKGESEKFFFGGGSSSNSANDHISRAPSHDTPASPCKCSTPILLISNYSVHMHCFHVDNKIFWIFQHAVSGMMRLELLGEQNGIWSNHEQLPKKPVFYMDILIIFTVVMRLVSTNSRGWHDYPISIDSIVVPHWSMIDTYWRQHIVLKGMSWSWARKLGFKLFFRYHASAQFIGCPMTFCEKKTRRNGVFAKR